MGGVGVGWGPRHTQALAEFIVSLEEEELNEQISMKRLNNSSRQ